MLYGLYLKDIVKRCESCVFCRLIVEALCKWITQEELTQEELLGTRKECHLFSYLYADNKVLTAASVDSLVGSGESQRAYRIGIGVGALTELSVSYLDHAGDIQLSAISAAQYDMSRLFHGRVIDTRRVNMALARDWLSECETDHKQKCSLPGTTTGGSASPAGPRDLLVVDVLLMNLCRMPHGSRYIALSYCWPKVNKFVTTKSSLTGLYIPGALRDKEERMFQAIQDAIQCVSELGERYLWVDALCIIQDDEEHKSFQVQQMDRVYGSSLLTLIHAPPEARPEVEAHNGLAGYRKRYQMTKQVTYQVQGLELLIPFTSLNDVISGSLWTTRAWTFQEERLSRRNLYFTETQMYFQCSCAVFCEDSVGEGIHPSACIEPATNLWNSSGIYSSLNHGRYNTNPPPTWLSRTPIDDPVKAIAAYSRSVAQFSGRQMSNARDILASFEGILSVLREFLKTDFWFGLPERYLDEALLWIEAGPSLRRNAFITPSSKMLFPTWSWAGWDTRVDQDWFLPVANIYPEVEWYVIRQSGEAIQLVTPGSYNGSLHPEVTSGNRNVRPPAGPPDDFLEIVQHRTGISKSKKRKLPRFLACWTCIASFGIGDEKSCVDGFIWTVRKCLPVLDAVGHQAGCVSTGQGWEDNIKGNSHTFEFMLLSRSDTLIEGWGCFDMDVFTSRKWCLLNVMLIKRDGDRAQRVSIGVIHEDAWVEANPVPMLIKLE